MRWTSSSTTPNSTRRSCFRKSQLRYTTRSAVLSRSTRGTPRRLMLHCRRCSRTNRWSTRSPPRRIRWRRCFRSLKSMARPSAPVLTGSRQSRVQATVALMPGRHGQDKGCYVIRSICDGEALPLDQSGVVPLGHWVARKCPLFLGLPGWHYTPVTTCGQVLCSRECRLMPYLSLRRGFPGNPPQAPALSPTRTCAAMPWDSTVPGCRNRPPAPTGRRPAGRCRT